MRLLALPFLLLLSTAAFAAPDRPAENIFGADLSNPDLALAVTSFEDVCMPFILHKTELPHAMNKTHWAKQMAGKGFEFTGVDEKQFRVLTRVKDREEIYSKSPLVFPTGEIDMRAYTPAVYSTGVRDTESYRHRNKEGLTANLETYSLSQNYPAQSCGIKFEAPLLDQAGFIQGLIEKDADWQSYKTGWRQCVNEGDGSFFFTAERSENGLSITVTRNGFYQKLSCQ